MRQHADTADSQNTMQEWEFLDDAELVEKLLKIVLQEHRREKHRNVIRDKSVGHPDYPSIMPDYTGLA